MKDVERHRCTVSGFATFCILNAAFYTSPTCFSLQSSLRGLPQRDLKCPDRLYMRVSMPRSDTYSCQQLLQTSQVARCNMRDLVQLRIALGGFHAADESGAQPTRAQAWNGANCFWPLRSPWSSLGDDVTRTQTAQTGFRQPEIHSDKPRNTDILF